MDIAGTVSRLNILSLAKLTLLLMIFGLFTIDNRGVLNVATGLMVILSLYQVRKEKINIKNAIGDFLKKRKSLVVFSLWCIVCIAFFTYKNEVKDAFNLFFKDWRYPFVLFLFFISFNKDILVLRRIYVVGAIFTLTYIIIVVPVIRYIKDAPQPLYLQLRYGFAFYVVMLFPFALVGAVLIKNIYMKMMLAVVSFSAFIFLLYTGSRGGILALAVETAIILFICVKNIKALALVLLSVAVITGAGLTLAYNAFPQVKHKIDQSTNSANITSGRDKIITGRYPLVMDSMKNAIFGIGYGNSTFDAYLIDHNAPKNGGVFNWKTKKYNLDEPLFLTVLYNIGFGGLILFVASMAIVLKDMVQSVRTEKNIFNVSLLASFIGYFLVYCLFEKTFMEIYFLYSIMALLFASKYNNQRDE